jgi:hypothetical protein
MSRKDNWNAQIMNFHSNILKDATSNQYQKEAHTLHRRELLNGGDFLERQVVTFENCLFQNNSIGPEGDGTNDGVIYTLLSSNDLILKSCTFKNNNYAAPLNGVRFCDWKNCLC